MSTRENIRLIPRAPLYSHLHPFYEHARIKGGGRGSGLPGNITKVLGL